METTEKLTPAQIYNWELAKLKDLPVLILRDALARAIVRDTTEEMRDGFRLAGKTPEGEEFETTVRTCSEMYFTSNVATDVIDEIGRHFEK